MNKVTNLKEWKLSSRNDVHVIADADTQFAHLSLLQVDGQRASPHNTHTSKESSTSNSSFSVSTNYSYFPTAVEQ